jgi:hypothetical protein
MVLLDWQRGRLPFYSLPPGCSATPDEQLLDANPNPNPKSDPAAAHEVAEAPDSAAGDAPAELADSQPPLTDAAAAAAAAKRDACTVSAAAGPASGLGEGPEDAVADAKAAEGGTGHDAENDEVCRLLLKVVVSSVVAIRVLALLFAFQLETKVVCCVSVFVLLERRHASSLDRLQMNGRDMPVCETDRKKLVRRT